MKPHRGSSHLPPYHRPMKWDVITHYSLTQEETSGFEETNFTYIKVALEPLI